VDGRKEGKEGGRVPLYRKILAWGSESHQSRGDGVAGSKTKATIFPHTFFSSLQCSLSVHFSSSYFWWETWPQFATQTLAEGLGG